MYSVSESWDEIQDSPRLPAAGPDVDVGAVFLGPDFQLVAAATLLKTCTCN